ncbi:iron chelate uptake ABC transporter family permease subunit [Vibrio sonorensis]|uniref:iron chelate uptake ABC transporter family permease subunit n=1 Tax=Vibrio sonorensis TaxID=1004316 RepID=UPI0008DA4960|nr:iron chelate uptake ABC transporter family permease subunit [Vibrio sonorensis]
MRDRTKLFGLALIALLFMALFIGIGLNADNYQYFLSRRVPKVLAMVLAGIALAQATLTFQTITDNRILTPSIMGFDSLYLLTQVLVVAASGSMGYFTVNEYANFALSLTVMVGFSVVLFSFYFKGERLNLMMLLLLGVILGQLFGNLSSFFIMMMDPNEFASVQENMFASFNNVKVELVYICGPVLALVTLLLYKQHRTLDVFWLGKDNAMGLGVNVKAVSMRVLVLTAILVSISTALIGPIMFFGFLVCNLTREMFNTYEHKTLLLASSLLSVAALLSGQWIIENAFGFSTTLSVVINFIGGIYFLSLLLRNKIS